MRILNRPELFNKRASDEKSKPDEIIKSLNIMKDGVVLDIGSGGGYYAMRFAAEVGANGGVYAADVNPDLLQYIDIQSKKSGLLNITTVVINDKIQGISSGSCDLIFLRNSFHHIKKPEKYFMEIKHFLKSGGRIAIIDYKKTKGLNFHNLMGHYAKEEDIIATLTKAGYTHVESLDFLPEQSFNIFIV